jgi:dynein heavy chain
MDALIR